jgi:hypothetical protein
VGRAVVFGLQYILEEATIQPVIISVPLSPLKKEYNSPYCPGICKDWIMVHLERAWSSAWYTLTSHSASVINIIICGREDIVPFSLRH